MDITATDFLKHAVATAEHYGFRNMNSLKKDPICKNCREKVPHTASAADRRADALHGMLTGGINAYADEKLHAFETPVFYYNIEQVPRSGETAVTFH
ncbi:MAG: hypothetical protein AAFO91_17345, partial [Bacteroidota bacterium]